MPPALSSRCVALGALHLIELEPCERALWGEGVRAITLRRQGLKGPLFSVIKVRARLIKPLGESRGSISAQGKVIEHIKREVLIELFVTLSAHKIGEGAHALSEQRLKREATELFFER